MKFFLITFALFALCASVALAGGSWGSNREQPRFQASSRPEVYYPEWGTLLPNGKLPTCCIDTVGLKNYVDKLAQKVVEDEGLKVFQAIPGLA